MPIIDSQVHAYEANTPKRPWATVPNWPPHVTGDEMVAAMNKVGVDGAIFISSFSMYRYDGSYAEEVARQHPGRMAIVKPVDPDDENVADVVAKWKETQGAVGIRIFLREEEKRAPDHPGFDRICKAAVDYDLPLNFLFWGRVDDGIRIIDRHPNVRFIVDHLGLLQPRDPPAPAEPWADLPKILDLAKLSAGRLDVHREPLSLRAFVIDVASEVEPLVIEKGLALSIQVPATLPRVSTDPTHLRQILVNLLGNAVKFTANGGITLRAAYVSDGSVTEYTKTAAKRPLLAAGGNWIALQVIDTGVGIAEKDHERIFEEFEQVAAGSRRDSERRGTGLGLSITRRLARLLDGDITLESEPGRGSAFTCWIPADPAPPSGAETA